MMRLGPRNIFIALGVFIAILLPGALLLHDAGPGLNQALCVAAFVACFVVLHALDDRELRRRRNR